MKREPGGGMTRIETGETFEKESHILGLEEFPASVREEFEQLPDSLKNKILSQISDVRVESLAQISVDDLEEMIAGFDTETREQYTALCLMNLFSEGNFRDSLHSVDADGLSGEVSRLLDVLWENRGKGDQTELYNKDHYDQFFADREILAEKVIQKVSEIEALRTSLIKTRKKKRLTRQKNEKLQELNEELMPLEKDLRMFDATNDNTQLSFINRSNVASRRWKEQRWTMATAKVSEYLDPTEFVTVVAEQIDLLFSREERVLRKGSKFYKKASDEYKARARKQLDAISQAVEDWETEHEEDNVFKSPKEAKKEKRKNLTINYLISLMKSYSGSKKVNRTDEEMVYTIRQMEIALKLLNR